MTDEAIARRVVALLTERGVPFRIHEHPVARTVEEAKTLLPFPPEQFLKTVAFRVKGGPWMLAALRGEERVDYRKLAEALGVKRADLVRPDAAAVEAGLGYAIGGVGPIPPHNGTQTIIDTGATVMERVYCGMGRDDQTLEIALADLIAVSGAQLAPIAQGQHPVA